MVILEFPHDIAKKAGVTDIANRYIDRMGNIYDHMDHDLADMGQFILSGADLNGITKIAQFDVLTAQKAMERGQYPSIIGLDDVMNRELYHGLVRIAKTAGNIACKEERETGLEWALGSATCMVGVHVNYVERFVDKFIAGYDVGKQQVTLLEKIRGTTRVEFDKKGVHRRLFIHPDGDITDAQDEREKVADHVRSGAWYDKRYLGLWPVHMISVVDRVRVNTKALDEPTSQESHTITPTEIVDRPIPSFKKISKNARDLHELLGALVRGDHVVITSGDRKETIELPTTSPDVAKRVVGIVAAYRGDLDILAAQIQAAATEHPEIAEGDETMQALVYLESNLETLRVVSKGGRGNTRPWAAAVR